MVTRAVFFDRDGVINKLVQHGDQLTAPWTVDEFVFLPNVREAFDIVVRNNYVPFIVTNQPDVYDNKMAVTELENINAIIYNTLPVKEIVSAKLRGSTWYKPNNGMVEHLISKYQIDRFNSFLIGDRDKDINCGKQSKVQTILVSDHSTSDLKPDYIVRDCLDGCKLIERLNNDVAIHRYC